MSTLKDLIQQHHETTEALQTLQEKKDAAESQLVELEANTDLSFEKFQKQSGVIAESLERCNFELKSTERRIAALTEKLKQGHAYAIEQHRQAERDANTERRQLYAKLKDELDWALVRKQLAAMSALNGGYWDSTLIDLIGYEPRRDEYTKAVQELDWWIDDPIEPSEIFEARGLLEDAA